MPSPRQTVGFGAERRAESLLNDAGLDTVTRNFQSRYGEIDLVMTDGDILIIVEVRQRKSGARVSAMESVTPIKQQRLCRATEFLLRRFPKFAQRPIRFDVVAIDGATDTGSLRWIRDAFRP